VRLRRGFGIGRRHARYGNRATRGQASGADLYLAEAILIWNIEQGLALTGPRVATAQRQHSEIFGRMKTFLRGYDVLAAPTVQVAPFPVEQEWVTAIDGVPQDTYIDWLRSCSRITVTGHPAVSVPASFTADGLPAGLQLVGRYGTDDRLLSIAGAVARVLLPEPARLVSPNFRDR
jgi:amidase